MSTPRRPNVGELLEPLAEIVEVTDEEGNSFEVHLETTQVVEVAGPATSILEVSEAPGAAVEVYADETTVVDVVRDPTTVIEVLQMEGARGPVGPRGPEGGPPGPSAYEVWLAQGNTGTEAEYFVAMRGPKGSTGDRGPKGDKGGKGDKGDQGIQGKSPYQVAVEIGYSGTEQQWLESLRMPASGAHLTRLSETALPAAAGWRKLLFDNTVRADPGFEVDPASGYITVAAAGWYALEAQVRLVNPVTGYHGISIEADSVVLIEGPQATTTSTGAFATGVVYLDAGNRVQANYYSTSGSAAVTGDLSGRLVYLRAVLLSTGPKGDKGERGDPGGPMGPKGDKGDSPYEIAVANGFVGTEAQWLATLRVPASGATLARLSTTSVAISAGTQQVTAFDSTLRLDPGFSADQVLGTVTVPSDGWYALEGHVRFATAFTSYAVLTVTADGVTVVRGPQLSATWQEVGVSGMAYLAAGTVLRLILYVGSATQIVGSLDGSYLYFRAALISVGERGADGTNGLSAHQVWLEAGNTGTVADYLASLKGAQGDVGTLIERDTATYATASLATNANEVGLVTMAKGWRLMHIATSRPARVRLYGTAAKRDADLSRSIGTDPLGDHGLLFEYVTTDTTPAAYLSPQVEGANFETPVTTEIPISVRNLGPTGPVVVTLLFAKTE